MREYAIQQKTLGWETIPEGEFASAEEARAAMEELEASLGWRGLRIVKYTLADGFVGEPEVVLLGAERAE